jgi:hypothetical protein
MTSIRLHRDQIRRFNRLSSQSLQGRTFAPATTPMSSAEAAYTVCHVVEFASGTRVAAPGPTYLDETDARKGQVERTSFLQAIAQAVVMIPTGGEPVRMSLSQLLAELGIKALGISIEQRKVMGAIAVAKPPKIVLASH